MKITRRFLIAVAVVLALAVIATPVIASRPPIYELVGDHWSDMTFTIPPPPPPAPPLPPCTLTAEEWSTKHILFGRPMASTNVGRITATGFCPKIPVGGGGIPIPPEVWFAVVDVRNPGNGTVIATYGIATVPGELPPLPWPVQAGANAWLKKHGPSLTYEGYVYVCTVRTPDGTCQHYEHVQFVAEGYPPNFTVYLSEWK
jgi:hypothetical protein